MKENILGFTSFIKKSSIILAAFTFLVSGFFVVPNLALATTSGPSDPTAAVNATGVGTIVWTNPTRAESFDSSYSTANSLASGEISNYLKVTNYGFNIPLDATILGIKIDISRKASFADRIKDQEVKIVKEGSIIGTNQASTTAWSNTDFIASYGGSSDLWGQSWTSADINTLDFGLVLAVTNTGAGSRTASVDNIKITVTYTIPANLTAYNTALAAVTESDYTVASWTTYQGIVTANVVTTENTQAEVDTATANITAAQSALVLDLIPPVISTQTTTNPAETSLIATWTTDHVATSRVVYDTIPHVVLGIAPNYGYANSTVEDTTVVTSHSVTVSGLSSGTTYFFRTISRGSPEAVSDEFSGTTSNPPTPTPPSGGNPGGHRHASATPATPSINSGQVFGATTVNVEAISAQITSLRIQVLGLLQQLVQILQAKLKAQQ